MDWYLDDGDSEGATVIRREFVDYLRRHADSEAEIDLAALAFAELVNNGVEHAGGPVWVSVDWAGRHPVVAVNDLGSSFQLSEVAMTRARSAGEVSPSLRIWRLVSMWLRKPAAVPGLKPSSMSTGGTSKTSTRPVGPAMCYPTSRKRDPTVSKKSRL